MQYMKEASARSFFILTLVISLMFAGILNTNATIGINAFAKKSSKTIFDRGSNDGNGRTSDSRGKGSSLDSKDNTSFKKDTKSTEPFVPPSPSPPLPLSAETPTNSKYVIINFDDSHQSDYTYAKPILDKYGFKATFFEVCNWIEAGYHDKDISVTWQQIAALQQDGMDIEAHTMNHPNLNHLSSQADLDYEIGQSKQCLENHGFNPTIFAYPNGDGSDNPEVVNTVAKYYDLARTAESDSKSALTFLNCDSGSSSSSNVNSEPQQQQKTYCATYLSDGELAPENRYSISSWAHKL